MIYLFNYRIGRTGRSNNKGTSYTFFTASNGGKVDELINILNETNQYVNPELYQLKKFGNNRRGGMSRNYGGGGYKKSFGGGSYGRSNGYENGGGYNNGASGSKYGDRKPNTHTRFDNPERAAGYSNGSRFQ